MASTPKNLPAIQDKRAEVVKLRAQGLTWDQVAAEVGYANGSSALEGMENAIQQTPDLAVKEIRAAERERLSEMDAVLANIVAHPPAKTTAIGKTVIDPDTGETVRDMAQVIAAIRERRQVGKVLPAPRLGGCPSLAPWSARSISALSTYTASSPSKPLPSPARPSHPATAA